MSENAKLVELVSHMLDEQRETNRRLGDVISGVDGLNTRMEGLTVRVERLENHQQTTNVILKQHGRDLERIADLLSERVPHWGDTVAIDSKKRTISGTLKRAG